MNDAVFVGVGVKSGDRQRDGFWLVPNAKAGWELGCIIRKISRDGEKVGPLQVTEQKQYHDGRTMFLLTPYEETH